MHLNFDPVAESNSPFLSSILHVCLERNLRNKLRLENLLFAPNKIRHLKACNANNISDTT